MSDSRLLRFGDQYSMVAGADDEGVVTIVGTQHTSADARTHIADAIAETEPDVVAVELGRTRFESTFTEDGGIDWEELPVGTAGQYLFKAFGLAQKHLSEVDPLDGDMLSASLMAHHSDTPLALVDIDIHETISGLAGEVFTRDVVLPPRSVSGWMEMMAQRVKLYRGLYDLGLFPPEMAEKGPEDLSPEELDRLFELVSAEMPELVDVMLRRRNRVIAGHLDWLRKNEGDVVAVMGAAHVAGTKERLEVPSYDAAEYAVRPPIAELEGDVPTREWMFDEQFNSLLTNLDDDPGGNVA